MANSEAKQLLSPVTEAYPIQVLCNFITPYQGERETLSAFLTNCQNALDLASDSQKFLILKFIISKLQGKAQVACSNKIFDNFEDLRTFLRQNFGERKHYNHLLLELQSCKQLPNETVAQYALRVETCLTDLQSEIHNSNSLKKELAGRIAMTEDLALHTFCLGLHPNISNIVRCRDPRNLNAAISIATEEEKIYKYSVKSSCKVCNKMGHSESECRFRIKQSKIPYPTKQYYNANKFRNPHELPTRNPYEPSSSSSQPVICRYCKNIGHDISQCRKRQYNNSRFDRGNVRYTTREQKYVECANVSAETDENNDDDLN
ncbi:hypothetical protein B5X24_HaOG207489 [Helicoverpa armigera]|nr:hypothetical protein B5X24_HaOG207489 [Helicoverpa armigera]